MPRPQNTEERRAQISDGLIRVMAKRGYDGASVAEIARAAQLTPGLVHYHFKSKQEILLAALTELVTRHQTRLDDHLERAEAAAPARVAAFIDLHLGLGATADPDALACWILLSGEALRQPAVKHQYKRAVSLLVQRLEGIIQEGLLNRHFVDVDAKAAAAAIFAAIQGYFALAAVSRDLVPRGTAGRSLLQMAEGLLGTDLPAPHARGAA